MTASAAKDARTGGRATRGFTAAMPPIAMTPPTTAAKPTARPLKRCMNGRPLQLGAASLATAGDQSARGVRAVRDSEAEHSMHNAQPACWAGGADQPVR
jgi:hypothetical protein